MSHKYWIDEDAFLAHDTGVNYATVSRAAIDNEHVEPLSRILDSHDDLLAACKHGAMSNHHPSCSHGKRGDGNTCECHVKKCQLAFTKAESTG